MPGDRLLQVVLATLAVLDVELLLAAPEQGPWVAPLRTAAWTGGALLVRRLVRRCATGRPAESRNLHAAILWSLALLPFLWNRLPGMAGAQPLPLELSILAALRNTGMGLLALSGGDGSSRLAAVVSLVQVFAVSMLSDRPAASILVAAYAATGCLWLVLLHWNSLPWPGGQARSGRLPWAVLFGLAASIAGAAALGGWGGRRAAGTLGEWFPSSGGSLAEHPNARAGVGSGLDSAGDGEHADSTGFDGGDTFRESDLPSLYDVMTEVYGTPRPPDQIERAIALSPDKIRFKQGLRRTHSHKAGRTFSMLRHSPPPRGRPRSIEADALLYVRGPTPLHLRTAVYDRFDGICWHEPPAARTPSAVYREPGSCWMSVPAGVPDSRMADTAAHEIRFGLFDSACIPVPLHLERFRVGLVDQPGFFRRSTDGLLSMVRRVPPAMTVETVSSILHPEFPASASCPAPSILRENETDLIYVAPEVAALAEEWAGGLPRGWPQIRTVLDRLGRHCRLDPSVATDDAARDPTACFLCTLRRGPAYHFASASAVMLHSLGYRLRLVSGFYASPDRFDRRTGHTAVTRDDLHFWAELRLADGTWLTLEPTPGHETLKPALPLRVRLLQGARGLCLRVLGAWPGMLAASCIAVLLTTGRRRLADTVLTLAWRLGRNRSWQEMSLRTLWLLDHRCQLAGCSRPPSVTPTRWYEAVAGPGPHGEAATLRAVVRAASQAAFAPAARDPEIRNCPEACRRAVEYWTVRRLRRNAGQRRSVG